MFLRKKSKLKHMVIDADNAKKVNPLDLSADQDLTIAIMNLIKLEQYFTDVASVSGYDMGGAVRDMRHRLMSRVVSESNTELWDLSQDLLGQSMDLIDSGIHQLADKDDNGYKTLDNAYEMYSLFWGINMGLVDVADIKCGLDKK